MWNGMIDGGVDGAVLRMKGDMTCENTAMRDPTLFRIIESDHPVHGDRYRVWPTYDFAGAVEDSTSGVTHPFRTKEYELRDQCYFHLLDLLGLRKPFLMEFARLSITGMPVSKRKIKPLIEKKLVHGYDDIRLPTLRGLKKRGILPEAIKNFVIQQGISKVESEVPFSLVESANRKIVDPVSKRYFFVQNPVKLKIKNAPMREKTISFHPTDDNLGSRKVQTKDVFYIPREDLDSMKTGEVFRLKDLFNVKIIKKNDTVMGEFSGEKVIPDSKKIQWTTDDFVELEVFVPDLLFKNDEYNVDSLKKVKGFGEKAFSNAENGEIVQLERFGFARLEKNNGKITAFFSHK